MSNVITYATLNQKYRPHISQEVKLEQSNFVHAPQHFRRLTPAGGPSQCGRLYAVIYRQGHIGLREVGAKVIVYLIITLLMLQPE